MAAIASAVAFTACEKRHPDNFGDICSVYFYNLGQGSTVCDSTDVTFVYDIGDTKEVNVTVRLLGRAADYPRPVDITVSSENAIEGTDYILPESAVMPAGAYSFDYKVTLLRTEALKSEKKEISLQLVSNGHFSLDLSEIGLTTGNVSVLDYRIIFSDMFTSAPSAWDTGILGEFSQKKFELICNCPDLEIDPADFNDATVMTAAKQMYIFEVITDYIEEQTELKEAGEEYDHNIDGVVFP